MYVSFATIQIPLEQKELLKLKKKQFFIIFK